MSTTPTTTATRIVSRTAAAIAALTVLVGAPASFAAPRARQPAPPAGPALPADVVDVVWQWERLTTPVEEIVVPDPAQYTLRLRSDGVAVVTSDCNRGSGRYAVPEDHKLTFTYLGVSRKPCSPESLSGRYVADLKRVTSFFVRDGFLYLELPVDSGTFKFRLAKR